jgi:uncharacterized repeat protein (TIGR03803 family)
LAIPVEAVHSPTEPVETHDGPLPWTVPNFLKTLFGDGSLGTVSYDFSPATAVKGRDGKYYSQVNNAAHSWGGLTYSLAPNGTARLVRRFPYVVTQYGVQLTGPREFAVGEDGAIYGTAGTGVFGKGVLYRMDTRGRFQTLHNFEQSMNRGLLVAQNGDIYAGTAESSTILSILKLSRDGSYKYIPVSGTGPLKETADHQIVLLSVGSGGVGVVSRLNASDEFEPVAQVGVSPRELIPLANGDVLASTNHYLFQVTPAGVVTVVHEFVEAVEGICPYGLVVAQDGSYLASTLKGGANGGGTYFRLEPGTHTLTVLGNLPVRDHTSLNVSTWMADVFPLRVSAEGTNLPPMAKDDFVNAATLRRNPAGLPQAVIRVLANDSDANKDALTIASVGAAEHGVVTLDATSRLITYTANAAPVQNDAFTYTIADGHGGTATAHVFIRTNPAGRYTGQVLTAASPNPLNQTVPGVSSGSLTVNVAADRTLIGRLDLEGKIYRFTGRLNDTNQSGSVLLVQAPNYRKTLAIQVLLSADGAKWTVEAAIQRTDKDLNYWQNPMPFTASCAKP